MNTAIALLVLFIHTTHGIAPMGRLRHIGAPDIDELPGTEGYDALTGFISPNKKCTDLQVDYQTHCEEKEPTNEKETAECDARRGKWMGDCVFGDAPIE